MGKHLLLAGLLILTLTSGVFAQMEDEAAPIHKNEYGAGITLAMSGLGLGGFYRINMVNYYYLGISADFYILRDDREFTYYDYYGPIQINDVNQLFIIPVNVELKRRLFANDIENDFRPFVSALAGFTFGMNFPKKNAIITNPDLYDIPNGNEYRMAFSFGIGAGVDISTRDYMYFSIRPQYRYIFFPGSIAGEKNHSNFEIRLEVGKIR